MFRLTLLTFFVATFAFAEPHVRPVVPSPDGEIMGDREMTDAEYLTTLVKSLGMEIGDANVRGFQDKFLTDQLRKMKNDSAPVLERLAEAEPKFRPLVDKLQDNKIKLEKVTVFTCENKDKSNWGRYVVIANPSKKKEKGITLHIIPMTAPVMDANQPKDAKTAIAVGIAGTAEIRSLKIGDHPKVGEGINVRLTYEEAEHFDTFLIGRQSSETPLLHDTRATACKLPDFKQ